MSSVQIRRRWRRWTDWMREVGLRGTYGDDKQGQLPKLAGCGVWAWVLVVLPAGGSCTTGTLYCGQVQRVLGLGMQAGGKGPVCVLFGSTRQSAGQGRPGPHNLGEQLHKGPLIGHPLPLQRKRMCQRHPPAAWPPGRGGIRRPNGPSSHCGAGPRLHHGGAGAKTASCFFGRTLRNVHFGNARSTPSEDTFPLGPAHHHLAITPPPTAAAHQQPVHQLEMHTCYTLALSPTASRAGRGTDSQPWHDLT